MDQLDKIIKKNIGKVEDVKKKTTPSTKLKKESKSKTEEKTKKIETSSG